MLARNTVLTKQAGGKMEEMSFSELLKRAVYGVSVNIKQQIIATHKELQILRHCSELLQIHPNHFVHIISPPGSEQGRYFSKTLIHLGVASAKIKTSQHGRPSNIPGGLWLVVAESV